MLVQVALLAAFLYFFGFPAVARFAKKGVMVVETSKDTNGIPIPAISLAAVGQITGAAAQATAALHPARPEVVLCPVRPLPAGRLQACRAHHLLSVAWPPRSFAPCILNINLCMKAFEW